MNLNEKIVEKDLEMQKKPKKIQLQMFTGKIGNDEFFCSGSCERCIWYQQCESGDKISFFEYIDRQQKGLNDA
jgi:hypothetical protein